MLSAPGIDAEFSNEVIAASADAEVAVLNNYVDLDQPELPHSDEDRTPDATTQGSRPGDQPQGTPIRNYYRIATDDDPLLTLAETHSNAAVVAAFFGVEFQLRRIEELNPNSPPIRLPIRRLVEHLGLPPDIRASVIELSQVRNRASHAGERFALSPEAARSYIRSCREMIDWLEEREQQQTLFDLQ
jgi:hypothetical protein